MAHDFLETTVEIIDALGGNGAVEALTASKPSTVSNWRKFGTFPSNTYVVITGALAGIGKTAPDTLWGMKVPSSEDAPAEVAS